MLYYYPFFLIILSFNFSVILGYENFEPMPLSQFLADNDIKLVENSNESSVIIIDPVIFRLFEK